MTAISSAAQAELWIGASTADPLPAPGSDTFSKVPQLKSLDVPQPEKGSQSETTLDGVTISSSGTPKWSSCTGAFLTNFTQAAHLTMIGDPAVSNRKRNFYCVEPDSGARRTDFIGEIIRCKGGAYEAAEDGAPARRHEFEIVPSGTPTVTP